jgi:hypothetical protein
MSHAHAGVGKNIKNAAMGKIGSTTTIIQKAPTPFSPHMI